jgi:hypothetical protein
MSGEKESEDDDLHVPAGWFRVTLGLFMMTSGVFIAAFSENVYGDGLGLLLILVSPFIMLTSKKTYN